MKLIIEIPYEAYYTFKCELEKGNPNLNALAEIVAKGIPYNPTGDLISRSGVVAFLENLEFEPNAHWLAEVLQDKKRFPSIGGNQNE